MTLPRRRATPRARGHQRTFTPAHLRWLRAQLCETTQEFAKRWGLSHRTVEAWEIGARHPNRWIVARVLALYRACEDNRKRTG